MIFGSIVSIIVPVCCHFSLVAKDPLFGSKWARITDQIILVAIAIIMILTSILSLKGELFYF